mgnify:CR=1 FL=1
MGDTPRRQVLAAAATGSTLGLAGCGDLGGTLDGSAQTDDGGASEATVTVALDVQSEIQAAQQDIRERVESGNLSQEDAQAELLDAQAEVVAAAVDDLESYAGEVDGLRVENANEQAGAALVAGTPAAVLDALETDAVNALLAAADFPEPQREEPNGS